MGNRKEPAVVGKLVSRLPRYLLAAVGGLALAAGAGAQEPETPAFGPSAGVTRVLRNVHVLRWAAEPGSVWPRAELTPEPVDLAVAGDRIAGIGPGLAERYPRAPVIDGQGGYALPGLIDVHVHAGSAELGPNRWPLLADVVTLGRIKGAHALAAGVTTLRSAGDAFPGVDLMQELWEQNPAGRPRLEYVGPMFTVPGGHPVSTIFRGNPYIYRPATRQVASAPQAAAAAREVLAEPGTAPSTLKAIYTTAGGRLPRLSQAALRALVDEAAEAGAVVIVHTDTVADLLDAVAAGAWGVEHGVTTRERLTPAQARRLADAGVFYSPTLSGVEQVYPGVLPAALQNVGAVYAAGAPVVTGTDAGNPGVLFGLSVLREIELLHEAGLPAAHALAAATYQAARYLRVEEHRGTLAPGFAADVVVVAGNPLVDPKALRAVRVVLRGGEVARLQERGRADGGWNLEPFVEFDHFVTGGSLVRRTDGPLKLGADAGYVPGRGRLAYRLRAALGRSAATFTGLEAGDWPGSPVLGREGQEGLTAARTLAQNPRLRLDTEAGFVRPWARPEETVGPQLTYGRALGYRWLYDERRAASTSLEAVLGTAAGEAAFASLVQTTRVELGELRVTFRAGVSQVRGAGLPGFEFSLGGPGGPASLRGYEPGHLSGPSMAGLTLDYRWLPNPNLPFELHAFADAATAGSTPQTWAGSRWSASAGLGLGLALGPAAVLRLDAAATPAGPVVPTLWLQSSLSI